ncbi:NitT/TauT family transport system permease protein [Paucimonas lemoignei]|uniref:NitT/TauT family transport system permease protein n=1 Tax=Paucimonas lemoignei TaxID=29443 RepID=A0A4R3HQA4_PAULE|nr:ABC transporter permease [Paucimonas lemoignei]TCS33756.1 NitT/TauT family transport system permease protein [Paucimonas lemoignei]
MSQVISATITPVRRLPRFDTGSVLSVVVAVVLLGGWEYCVRAGVIPGYLLPSPSKVVMQLYADLMHESVRVDIYYTLAEILLGFALATVLGLLFGAAIALIPIADKILSPYITCLQTIPKPAIAPLLIIWFGFGISSKVVIVALIAFYPIVVNAVVGFRGSDPRQILLMRVMKASRWQIFRMVQLPNALPYLMAGLQIAMVFSVIGAIVGEFLGASRGLGALIIQRQAAMDVAGVFSVLVVLSTVGIVLSVIIKALSKKLVFWGPAEEIRGV